MPKNTTARDSGDAAPASRAGAKASSSSNPRMKKDCTTCGSPASQRCKPCLKYGVNVYYCSKACQQSDWKVHKKICGPKYDGTLDILGKDSSSFLAKAAEKLENMTDEKLEAMRASMPGGAGMPRFDSKMAKQAASLMKNLKPEAMEGMLKMAAKTKDMWNEGAPSAQDLQRFVSSWEDINFVTPGANCTMLHVAAEEGSEETVRAMIAAGADVDRASICEKGYTPLIMAAQGGSEPVAQALIDAGADVNKADKSGVTPMRVAAHNGHEAVMRALIAAGAVEDEATKILRHRNAMQQLLQGISGRSLPEMPTADGIHGFDPRTGQWVNFGTGRDAAKAFLKGPKDRSGGRE